MSTSFQALVVRQAEEKQYSRKIETRSIDDLPEGEVLVRVHYSSLNYKDGLSCIGAKGVTREYPHTPGMMLQELSSRAVPTNSNPEIR